MAWHNSIVCSSTLPHPLIQCSWKCHKSWKYRAVHISPASPGPSVRRQTSPLFVLIIEQPPTAHLNSPARPSGGLFSNPCHGMTHFYERHFGPHRAQAAYALNPARRVNLPALIKIASFVAPPLPPSSCPRWHNGAGNVPLQHWLKRTGPLEKWSSTILWWIGEKKKSHISSSLWCDLLFLSEER